jgi:hypothetical protein
MLVFLFVCFACAAPSRCFMNDTNIICSYLATTMPITNRAVYYQVPLGNAPANGFPAVLMFQGSFFGPTLTWSANKSGLDWVFGGYAQTSVVKSLLDAGFAGLGCCCCFVFVLVDLFVQVLTPAAPESLFWETNVPPWDVLWNTSSDHDFMLEIISHIQKQTTFGPLDANHLFATGISSGGYMTSRVAVSLTKYFRAVAIESGSYMICGGPACEVPGSLHCGGLPLNHPPTLFLHGLVDPVVPYWTMELYYTALNNMKTPTRKVVGLFCFVLFCFSS